LSIYVSSPEKMSGDWQGDFIYLWLSMVFGGECSPSISLPSLVIIDGSKYLPLSYPSPPQKMNEGYSPPNTIDNHR
jgi:hypothetical protein